MSAPYSLWVALDICLVLIAAVLVVYGEVIKIMELFILTGGRQGGHMVSVLDSGASVLVQALVREIVLCSWARHFSLTVPLSTQVYKWVPTNLIVWATLRWTSISSKVGVQILLAASCHLNRD